MKKPKEKFYGILSIIFGAIALLIEIIFYFNMSSMKDLHKVLCPLTPPRGAASRRRQ